MHGAPERPPRLPRAGSVPALPPLAVDALLVALAIALVLLELRPVFVEGRAAAGPYRLPDDALGVALLASVMLPVFARRRRPLIAAAVGLLAALAFVARDYVPFGAVELVALLLVYSAASHGSRLPRPVALVTLGAWLLARELVQPFGFHLPGYAIECVVFGGAWMLGEFVRAQRAIAGQLAERAALLDRERVAREREAVHAERLRIARELHDVIAHHLSVIVIQAQAAGAALGHGSGVAQDGLEAIEASGREALTEMRRTLGLLRGDDADDGDDRAPQPGLDALDQLVAQLERAGLSVAVTVSGRRPELPRAVDLSAYRIVQEALTNSLRHGGGSGSGSGCSAAVRVRYGADCLDLEISDDGRGDAGAADAGRAGARGDSEDAGGGAGQIGMRERVALLGGELTLGPSGAGYRVHVSIPLPGASS